MSAYEQYYEGISLHKEILKQYQVDEDDLKHLLLSPRANHDDYGCECCESCNRSLLATKKESNEYNPPRYVNTIGFAIGRIPQIISFPSKNR